MKLTKRIVIIRTIIKNNKNNRPRTDNELSHEDRGRVVKVLKQVQGRHALFVPYAHISS